MPGKYSHSVVLADYSSRGIIVLPPDQHHKYAAQDFKTSTSQCRVRGARSAQASYQNELSISNLWKPATSSGVQAPLSCNASPATPHAKPVFTEVDKDGSQSTRSSRYYEQLPYSTPAVSTANRQVTSKKVQRPPKIREPSDSTTKEHRTTSRSALNAPTPSGLLTPEECLLHPVFRYSQSDNSLRKDAQFNHRPSSASWQRNSNDGSSSDTLALPSAQDSSFASRRTSMASPLFSSSADLGSMNVTVTDFARTHSGGKGTLRLQHNAPSPKIETAHISENPRTLRKQRVVRKQTEAAEVKRVDSNVSKITQIWSPPDNETEQNGNELSKQHELKDLLSYFEAPKSPVNRSRNSSLGSTLIIQHPESFDRPRSRGQSSSSTPVVSPKAHSSRTTDRNTPSRTTASSTIDSSRGQRTSSSASSISTPSGHVASSSVRMPESPKVTKVKQSTRMEEAWQLPEIKEDNGFSPSIFEDRGELDQVLKLDETSFERAIGQISSGKDVLLDDSASEMSAALPPPISRFKDEEDEFNANMARLFGSDGDSGNAKKQNITFGRATGRKTKNLFSRLRSRSQPPAK